MNPADYNLTIYRDRDFSKPFVFKDGDGVVINLTGYTAKAQVRPTKDSTTLTVEFTVVQVDVEGKVTLSLTDAQTLALAEGHYWWDLELTNPSGLRQNYVEGAVYIKKTVTRAA